MVNEEFEFLGLDTDALYQAIKSAGVVTNLGIGWLYAGFVFNIVFAAVVFFMERATSQGTGHMNYKSFFVLCLAAAVYMIQATIIKDYPIESNLIKYCYWLSSTPLIIIQLCELLDGMRMVAWLVVLDIMCMALGLLAWIVGESTHLRWLLYGVSCTCATYMFAMVGVLFYINNKLLDQAGYTKEKTIYKVIASIYFTGWTIFPIVFLLGFEGLGVINEDALCIIHVLLDLFCKDITEVLIVWVSYCFTSRMAHLSLKKSAAGMATPMETSYMNMMASRVPRNESLFSVLERDNPKGIKSTLTLSSVANVLLSGPSAGRSSSAMYASTKRHYRSEV